MKYFNNDRNKRDNKLFVVLAIVALAGWTQVAHARVSLSSIDAKLDALLAGQSIDLSNRVELSTSFSDLTVCPLDRAYHRIHPDGTRDATEFAVPAGFTLLILEVQWRAFDNPNSGFLANGAVRLTLSSREADGSQSRQFYFSPSFQTTSANTLTRPGNNETLIMGTAVGEGRIICGNVNSATQTSGRVHTIESSTLRGILVPDE